MVGQIFKRYPVKRRTVANEACDAGRILVNGKVAASLNVKCGDCIEIQFGNKSVKVNSGCARNSKER